VENSQRQLCLFSAVLLTVLTVGCGGSNNPPSPAVTVGATTHPLVAQYNIAEINLGATAWVEFGPDTNYGRQTSAVSASGSTFIKDSISILVAGMKAQTTYHMRAHATWPGGSWVDQDRVFTTGALPSSPSIPQVTVQTTPGASPAPGVELLSFATNGATVQIVSTDLQGNVIWYCPQNALPAKLMSNGHFLLNLGSDLQEVDLACNVVRDVSVQKVNQSLQAQGYSFTISDIANIPGSAGDFHHDMLVLPNGHWVAICHVAKSFTDLTGFPGTTDVLGDALVDIDLNGNVVWGWSAFDHLDVNRHLQGLPDWTHSNAILYTVDGNLLLSMRHQSWVLKIDYANGSGAGDVLWRLGEDGDFSIAGGNPADWFYAQHYPKILQTNGSITTMTVWDNGNLRIDSSGAACNPIPLPLPAQCYSRATIFQIDENTHLATLLWQDLPGFYSYWGGSIGVLSNGNVEFDMSAPTATTSSQIMEVTQTASPQTVWQMETAANAYRAYRMTSLYPGITWQQ
jgi:arylsulfate sulfotransferase